MRCCPKCGCEYRPEIETCPDCGIELIEQAPTPAAPLSRRAVVELAIVACLGPWLWYALLGGTGWALRAAGLRSIENQVAFAMMWIVALLIAGAAVAYGYRQRAVTRASVLACAWMLSGGLHAGISGAFLLAGMIPEPWKLTLAVPFEWLCSGAVLALVWIGSVVRHIRFMDKPMSDN